MVDTERLDAIEARIRNCETYNFGMRDADTLAHDDAAYLLARLRATEAERDDFREEARSAIAVTASRFRAYNGRRDSRIAELEARAAETEAVIAEALGASEDDLEHVVMFLSQYDGPMVLARVKAETWDACRQAVYDINGGDDSLDDVLNAANPYRAGADQ